MFSSLVQTPTLVVALCSLVVSGQQAYLGNGLTIPEQRMPLHDRPTAQTEPVPLEDTNTVGRNATIRLFQASPLSTRPMYRFGCKERLFNTISLATETCLSGDYYLNHNLLITETPICPDGEEPVMSYYHERSCEGKARYRSDDNAKGIPQYCLWGGYSPQSWSMIFRCSGSSTGKGADKHEEAIPPLAEKRLPYIEDNKEVEDEFKALEDPADGVVVPHLFPACDGKRVGGHKSMTVPVDRCLTIHGFGLQIKTPAVCANGTRAKWARFEDAKCGYGELSENYGLIDINDSDIGKCLSTGVVGDAKKVLSMSFWCDGFGDVKKPDPNAPEEPEKPKPAAGSVSESACMPRKAPFFNHPKTDTCVDLKTSRMKIYSTGVCTNGTKALLAKYKDKSCSGSPSAFEEVSKEKDNLEKCLDFDGVSSFAFWCEGKGITGPTPQPQPPRRKSMASVIMIFVLVILGVVLLLLAGVWAWFNTNVKQRVQVLLGSREGGIAL